MERLFVRFLLFISLFFAKINLWDARENRKEALRLLRDARDRGDAQHTALFEEVAWNAYDYLKESEREVARLENELEQTAY